MGTPGLGARALRMTVGHGVGVEGAPTLDVPTPVSPSVHPPVPPPAAAAQALTCHQCKGFGGCAHPSRCPWSSSYCVTIATREWGTCGVGQPCPCCPGEESQAGRGRSWPGSQQVRSRAGGPSRPQPGRGPSEGTGQGLGGRGQLRGSGACAVYLLSTPGIPLSHIDLPMVTKSCQSGCPDVASLGLGPHVSIACCQHYLCNQD